MKRKILCAAAVALGLFARLAVAGAVNDCNNNGIPDDVDIANATSMDRNLDGVPDECDIGACCLDVDMPCEQLNQVECLGLNGTWFRGAGCPGTAVPSSLCDRGACCPRAADSSAECVPSAAFECWGSDVIFGSDAEVRDFCDEAGCDAAANVSVRVVAVNGKSIAPTSAVVAHPGDSIEVEFYLSHWGPYLGALEVWQITTSTDAAKSTGEYGSIVQRSRDQVVGTCIDTGAACAVSLDCRHCSGGANEGGFCSSDGDCPGGTCTIAQCIIRAEGGYFIGDFVCSVSSTLHGVPCQSDDECPLGECAVRPDFVFASNSQRYCLVDSEGSEPGVFRAGCVSLLGSGPVPDGGGEYYAVTAVYDVSDDAVGKFTIVPAGPPHTFLGHGSPSVYVFFSITPAFVAVVPPPPTGACCDCAGVGLPGGPEVSCSNGRTQPECSGPESTWFEGLGCAEVTCDCPIQAIPTTSEWGLVVLTLALLIGVKLSFGVRRRPELA